MTKENAEDDKAAKGEHDGTSDNVEKPVNEVEQVNCNHLINLFLYIYIYSFY